MRYSDLNIGVSITLGENACFAINDQDELLIVQEKSAEATVVNLGKCSKARVRAIASYLERISIHFPE